MRYMQGWFLSTPRPFQHSNMLFKVLQHSLCHRSWLLTTNRPSGRRGAAHWTSDISSSTHGAGAVEDSAIIVFRKRYSINTLKISKELHVTFTRWYFAPVFLGTGTQLPKGNMSYVLASSQHKMHPNVWSAAFFRWWLPRQQLKKHSITNTSGDKFERKAKLLSWVTSQLKLRGWNYIYIIPIKWSLKPPHPLPPELNPS